MIFCNFKSFKDKNNKLHLKLNYAVDEDMNAIVLPALSPRELGAVYDNVYGWILKEKDD